MICLKNISKTYTLGTTKVQALKNINLTVNAGEFACIMGPSGSGKSTLLNIIGCLDKPDEGEVYIDSVEVTGLARNEWLM